MKQLSNRSLIEVYKRAKTYNLDKDFIELLRSELKLRGLILLDDENITVPSLYETSYKRNDK